MKKYENPLVVSGDSIPSWVKKRNQVEQTTKQRGRLEKRIKKKQDKDLRENKGMKESELEFFSF